MELSLVMFKSDGTRRDFPIRKDRVVVGRTNACDLRIPLSSVSRQHCEITVSGDEIRLRDLGSSNGTFHNDIQVEEARIDAGDQVSIGPVVFTLLVDGQPGDVEPVRTIVDPEQSVASGGNGQAAQAPAAAVATAEDDGGGLELIEDSEESALDLELPGEAEDEGDDGGEEDEFIDSEALRALDAMGGDDDDDGLILLDDDEDEDR